MRSNDHDPGDGFIHDFIPLVKNGFIILRSVLDVLIERIEEAEESRRTDIRRETYVSIVDVLEAEIENLRTDAADDLGGEIKVEALEAVISVLLRELETLDSRGRKKTKRPQKIKIR